MAAIGWKLAYMSVSFRMVQFVACRKHFLVDLFVPVTVS